MCRTSLLVVTRARFRPPYMKDYRIGISSHIESPDDENGDRSAEFVGLNRQSRGCTPATSIHAHVHLVQSRCDGQTHRPPPVSRFPQGNRLPSGEIAHQLESCG